MNYSLNSDPCGAGAHPIARHVSGLFSTVMQLDYLTKRISKCDTYEYTYASKAPRVVRGAIPGVHQTRGKDMLRRHLNFHQISHRFTSSFANPLFQDLNGSHIMYWNIYDNFKSVENQGWTPLKILIFLHWTLRPTFTTLLGKCRAFSHWMAVPKNRGKCKSATIIVTPRWLTDHVLHRLHQTFQFA